LVSRIILLSHRIYGRGGIIKDVTVAPVSVVHKRDTISVKEIKRQNNFYTLCFPFLLQFSLSGYHLHMGNNGEN
jgi:hypothetical protein